MQISWRIKFFSLVIGAMSIVKFARASQTNLIWNKRSRNFEPIPGSITHEADRREVMLQSRRLETHNFNGQPLNLTYYEDFGFFQYYDNDTKVSGICGDVWTILSNFLNFTLVLSKSEEPSLGVTHKNGTYTGILAYAGLNQTDVVPKMAVYITRIGAVEFSQVLWMNSLRIFAYGQWKRQRAWMFTQLSTNVWIFIFVFIGTLSLASFVTQRILIRHHRARKIQPENFFDHLFYSFATMCNQPGSWCDKSGSGWKMLDSAACIFSYLILIAYSSRLIYSMAEESFEAPFNDLVTLFDSTNFHLVVLKGSTAHLTIDSPFTEPIFDRIRRSKRLTIVTNLDDLYEKVCEYPNKYVMLDSEDSVAARGTRKCGVIPVGISYYLTPIAAGFSRRVKNRKALNVGILKLQEFGLLDAIKKRYVPYDTRERVIRQTANLAVDMDRVLIVFGILFLGIAVSIIICVAENIIFTVKKRKTIQYVAKKSIVIRKRIGATSTLLRSRKSVYG